MTTKLHPLYYLPLLEQAHANEIGVLVEVDPNDRAILANALYECKNLMGDKFSGMILFQPREDWIYIAHKAVELPP